MQSAAALSAKLAASSPRTRPALERAQGKIDATLASTERDSTAIRSALATQLGGIKSQVEREAKVGNGTVDRAKTSFEASMSGLGAEAKKLATSERSRPPMIRTCEAPRRDPTAMSAYPSPSQSPTARLTPPV